MSLRNVTAIILLSLGTAVAQSAKTADTKKADAAGTKKAAASAQASKRIPRPKSYDLAALDTTVNPCENFYEFSCGNWRKNNPVPSDQSRWGRFNELGEYNRQILHDILEKASSNSPKRDAITRKIGDFYASCMDEKTIEAKGASPLKPELDRIAAMTDKNGLIAEIAHLHAIGTTALFGFFAQPDPHNASMEMAYVGQGGLGLPDRDYYFKTDAKSKETREKYQAHLANMFQLLGDDEATAKKEAQSVMDLETKLADASNDRIWLRKAENRDHRMTVAQLSELAPNFQLTKFFTDAGMPRFSDVNVVAPDFFKKVSGIIDSVPMDDWKSYLRWHTTRAVANLLSRPFLEENFDFTGRYLAGQKEMPQRWKRCVQLTDTQMGEALGRPYVAATFGPDGKARMLKMVKALEESLATDIAELPWMTPETKKQAQVKLDAISNKIGYPENWKDYSSVKIVRGDLVGNVRQMRNFETHRNWNKIGKALDKKEWNMSPPTVNAYYNASENDINFPAGILQPPFFDKGTDDAVNFGGIGMVIGHELTHGFDDQGSKYDAEGNLTNWWTAADRAEFDQRTGCIRDEYSGFVAVDDVHVKGDLTLGENTADNGGIRIALMALRRMMAEDNAKKKAASAAKSKGAKTTKYTPDQRFFVGFAQIWCQNQSPASMRLQAQTDSHSPGEYRVNGTLRNDEDFAKAWGCKASQPMVSANACRVW